VETGGPRENHRPDDVIEIENLTYHQAKTKKETKKKQTNKQ
jgi:hypothetical protein